MKASSWMPTSVFVFGLAILTVGMTWLALFTDVSAVPPAEPNHLAQASATPAIVNTPAAPEFNTATSSSNTSANPAVVEAPTVKYTSTMTTVFWIGESADSSNGYISNAQSAWDVDWQRHYGGVDSPTDRCGYAPCAFTPRENAFYFALPYSDFTEGGELKTSARTIPWYHPTSSETSVVKNRWIEVRYQSQSCYAQWEDVGPFETDDDDYVFGSAQPKNQFGLKAGLDISPAVRDCLGMADNATTAWRFVEDHEVPDGPWKTTVTVSGVNW